MNANRIWSAGAAVVIIALVAATWFLGVAPQLSAVGQAAGNIVTVQAQNVASAAMVVQLKDQFAHIDDLRNQLAEARDVVPSRKAQSPLLAAIATYQAATGLEKAVAVTFGDPVPYVPGTSIDPELLNAMALVNAQNFLVIPMNLKIAGTYDQAMQFIQSLQTGTRLVLVHAVAMSEGGEEFTAEAQMFVLLDAADVLAPPATETTADTAAEGASQ